MWLHEIEDPENEFYRERAQRTRVHSQWIVELITDPDRRRSGGRDTRKLSFPSPTDAALVAIEVSGFLPFPARRRIELFGYSTVEAECVVFGVR